MRALPPVAARLSIRLLGRIEVCVGGVPVRLGGRQAQALFALLALDRRRRSRDAIATDLWPDAETPTSACLRQALWLVKSGLSSAGVAPDSILEIEPDLLSLRHDAHIELDVERFEEAVRSQPPDPETAIALYHGDLVDALGHECFAADRERLSDAYEDVLALAATQRLADDDVAGARQAAEALLARDPLREEAHAVLIGVYGAVGSRSQVVRQYRRLHGILERELQVEPLPETELAYREALSLTIARSRRLVATTPHLVRPLVAPIAARA